MGILKVFFLEMGRITVRIRQPFKKRCGGLEERVSLSTTLISHSFWPPSF